MITALGGRVRAVVGSGGLLKLASAYLGANVAVVVAQAVASLAVARLAGPENMGIFLTTQVILPYVQLLFLGITNGLNRELPLRFGQGRTDEVQRLADVAWWWTRLVAWGLFAGLFALGVATWLGGDDKLGTAWLAAALTTPLWFVGQNIEVTFRTGGQFLQLSRIKLAVAGLSVALVALLLVDAWWGLLLRSVVIWAATTLLLRGSRPIVPVPRWDPAAFRLLLRVGLPIFAVGWIFVFVDALDRTLILAWVGQDALGLYAPAVQIAQALMVLPNSINQVLYPRMCETYGRTGTARSLARLAFLPALALAVGLLPVFAFGWWFVDPFVRALLPDYTGGIGAARWVVVSMYFWSLSMPQNVFPTVDRLGPYVVTLGLGAVVMAGGSFWATTAGYGLDGVAMARAAAYAVMVGASAAAAAVVMFGRPRA